MYKSSMDLNRIPTSKDAERVMWSTFEELRFLHDNDADWHPAILKFQLAAMQWEQTLAVSGGVQ